MVVYESLNGEMCALREEIRTLKGVRNILADKLARYTGTTMPDELKRAEEAALSREDSGVEKEYLGS